MKNESIISTIIVQTLVGAFVATVVVLVLAFVVFPSPQKELPPVVQGTDNSKELNDLKNEIVKLKGTLNSLTTPDKDDAASKRESLKKQFYECKIRYLKERESFFNEVMGMEGHPGYGPKAYKLKENIQRIWKDCSKYQMQLDALGIFVELKEFDYTPTKKYATPKERRTAHGDLRTHKVKKDDTVYKISEKYGVSLSALRRLNPNKIGKNDLIMVGVRLTIPNESKNGAASDKDENEIIPSDDEDTSAPEDVGDTSAPEDVEDTSAPEDVEDTSAPEDVEDTSAPKDVEDTSAPEDVEDTSAPKDVEDTSAPNKDKN